MIEWCCVFWLPFSINMWEWEEDILIEWKKFEHLISLLKSFELHTNGLIKLLLIMLCWLPHTDILLNMWFWLIGIKQHFIIHYKVLAVYKKKQGVSTVFFYKGNWRWPARSDELAHDIQSTVANTTICLFLVKMVSLVNLMLQGNIAWMLPRKQ